MVKYIYLYNGLNKWSSVHNKTLLRNVLVTLNTASLRCCRYFPGRLKKKTTASLFIWLAIIRLKAIHPRYSLLLWKDVETQQSASSTYSYFPWNHNSEIQLKLGRVIICGQLMFVLIIFSKLSSLMSSREQRELTCWTTPHITIGEVTATSFFILYYKTPATKIESIK